MLHACFVRSPFARAAIRGIDTSAALAAPGVRFVFTAADLNPDVKEQWHTSIGPHGPETPRPPLADGEVRFVGDPVALVVAESSHLAEDAAELVDVDYEPLPPVVDYTDRRARRRARARAATARTSIGELAGLPASALEDVFAAAAHVVARDDLPAGVRARADGRPRAGRRLRTRRPASSRSTRRRSRRTRCACSARACSASPSTASASSCATPAAGSARRSGAARRDVPDARGAEGRRAGEVGRGPAREPARRGQVAPRARRRDAWPSTPTARSRPRTSTSSRTAARTRRRGRSMHRRGGRHAVPRPVPRAARRLHGQDDLHEHRRAHRVPRARGSSSRWRARCCSTSRPAGWASIRSSCAGATCCGATTCRTRNPNGMTYDSISPLETFEQALAMLDYDAFRAEQAEARAAGRYLGVGMSNYVEPSTPGYGYVRDRGGDDPHRAVGHGQRVHRRRLDREQPRDDGRAARRRRARRATSTTCTRSRATPRSPASARARPAAAAGR